MFSGYWRYNREDLKRLYSKICNLKLYESAWFMILSYSITLKQLKFQSTGMLYKNVNQVFDNEGLKIIFGSTPKGIHTVLPSSRNLFYFTNTPSYPLFLIESLDPVCII